MEADGRLGVESIFCGLEKTTQNLPTSIVADWSYRMPTYITSLKSRAQRLNSNISGITFQNCVLES